MGSRGRWPQTHPAVAMALRAAAIGVLAFAAAAAVGARFYATALVLAAIAVVVAFDLARALRTADRALAQFIDGLAAEGHEQPRPPAGMADFAAAMTRAQQSLARARAAREQRISFLETLLDTVSAALLVIDETGRIARLNRAARANLGANLGPLAAVKGLGADAARRIAALAGGGRDMVSLADGRAALVNVSAFSTPDQRGLRLVSVQRVSGDLDAVEVKAQHDLVRVLAHEMMNSLTPICSLSEGLLARLGDGAAPVNRGEIAEAVEVVARRSAGLMTFVDRYRRVADTPVAAKTSIEAARFVERLERLVSPLMSEAGVDYSSRVEPRPFSLEADADLLEHALINLLLNARDAVRGNAGASVRLACVLEADQVVFMVGDNGPGLPPNDHASAFVPFFTTKPNGSGVGLALARQVALAHDGSLEYRHASNGGAEFTLALPWRL